MFRGIRLTPDLPPVWLLASWAVGWALARWLPLARYDAGAWTWAPVAAGLALIGWAAVQFARADTPIEAGAAPSALLTGGPFRFTRSPIYLGFALILAGLCLRLGAVSALLPAAVYPLLLDRRFARAEERRLAEAFGDAARDWQRRVPRWLGRTRT